MTEKWRMDTYFTNNETGAATSQNLPMQLTF